MQKWASRDIKAALSEVTQRESKVGKLQSILTKIKSSYSRTISGQFTAVLSNLDSLVMYNPPEVSGVWISKGIIRSSDFTDSQIVEGAGYSPAESLAGLIGEVTITHAISLLANPVSPLPPDNKSTADAVRSDSLIPVESHLHSITVSIRHLATRADSAVSLANFSEKEGLQKHTAACAIDIRQRDAISRALCEQIRNYALHQWWNQNESVRAVTSEAEQLFSYYRKRCDQKERTKEERLLDISPAWGPQVFLAVSINKDGSDICIGSGCGSGAHIAICNAVLDLRNNGAELFWRSQHNKPIVSPGPGEREQSMDWLQKSFTAQHVELLEPKRKAVRELFWPQRTFVKHLQARGKLVER